MANFRRSRHVLWLIRCRLVDTRRRLVALLVLAYTAIDLGDITFVIGLGLVTRGAAELSRAAAYLVPGAILILCAVWPAILHLIRVARTPDDTTRGHP